MAKHSNNNQNYKISIGGIPLYDPSLGLTRILDLNLSLEDILRKNYTKYLAKYLATRARQSNIQIGKTTMELPNCNL
uniref:Uncharacterized protein n=1 Tax=Cucumis melo TaxID=3656 RepID=A0A9I9EAP3_CUCME